MHLTRRSLIEVLGQAWWVRRQSELTMTFSLAHLLTGRACAEALAGLVEQQVGFPMPVLTHWKTQPAFAHSGGEAHRRSRNPSTSKR